MNIPFYKSLSDSATERVISRSRFITRVFHLSNEEQAAALLKNLRKEYSDCTHICYGYIADIEGMITRSSDDGEPSGTAGIPILEAIKKRGYRQILVAVVRYFGGIKLGAGGLTRAYSECATAGMDNSAQLNFTLCDIYKLKLDFSLHSRISSALSKEGTILKTDYSDVVEVQIAIPVSTDFQDKILQLTGGKYVLEKLDTEYVKTT